MNKKRFMSVLISFLYCISLSPVSAESLMNSENECALKNEKVVCTATLKDDFADDCVIVVINSNYSGINKRFALSDFNEDIFAEIIDLSAVDGDISEKEYLNTESFMQILKLKLKKTGREEVLTAIKEAEKFDWVKSVEPNYISQPISDGEYGLPNESNSMELYSTISNDYNSTTQYALKKMNVPAAWDLETGKKDIRVGVIDTGILEHEDLRGNLVKGWDFVNNNDITNDDIVGHGTFVAGIRCCWQ